MPVVVVVGVVVVVVGVVVVLGVVVATNTHTNASYHTKQPTTFNRKHATPLHLMQENQNIPEDFQQAIHCKI